VEARVVPQAQRGHDQALEVGQYLFHRLWIFGRRSRQRVHYLAWLHLRENRQIARIFEIGGDPIHDLVTIAPELIRRHVEPAHRILPLRRAGAAEKPQQARCM